MNKKKIFNYILPIVCFCIVLFPCVKVFAFDYPVAFPVDYTDVCSDYFYEYSTIWETLVREGYNINPNLGILTQNSSTGRFVFYYPNESLNGSGQSVLTCTDRRTDGFLRLSSSNWSSFSFNSDLSYRNQTSSGANIGTCCLYGSTASANVIVYNAYYTLPYDNIDTFSWQSESNVEIPIPDLHDFGSSSATGHGSGSPSDEINLNGFTWSHSTGSLQTSGHSSNVNSSSSVFNFTDPTQNLLGQLNDNTNTLIGHTSFIFSVLQQINNNLITGFSSTFNALSTINNNIITLTLYDQEKVNETWDNTSAKQFFDETVDFVGHLEESIGDYQDYYFSSAGPSTLEIPIDFTSWSFSTTDYGFFTPFNQIYYMRFPFLDETKALWQPFLLGLLYFALFYTLFTDLPNILRGAVR